MKVSGKLERLRVECTDINRDNRERDNLEGEGCFYIYRTLASDVVATRLARARYLMCCR